MTRNHNRSVRMLAPAQLLALGVLSMGLAAANASADVLYDTTWMTDNGTYTQESQNYISSTPFGFGFWDVQVADDFTLSSGHNITSVTADLTAIDGLDPADGVLVEFFSDAGGAPGAASDFAVLTQNYSITNFTNDLSDRTGMRFTVDLSADGITLGAGTWWMSVQPVDESGDGDQYFWVRQADDVLIGNNAHARNGGEAHGNGYSGGYSSFDWGALDNPHVPGDVAMRINGTQIPTPGAAIAILLGIGGLQSRRRRNL